MSSPASARTISLPSVRSTSSPSSSLCMAVIQLGSVTLSELLATWPVHDMTHVHQIARILAHQYRSSVGPWQQYLGVLQCTGHSARSAS